MTQTASPIASLTRNPKPADAALEHAIPVRQTPQLAHAAHEARAVLHLPTRMRGVYRHAPSLKGA